VVYAARGSDVTTVVVDGRLLVRNRQPLHFDLGPIMERVNTLARAIGAKDNHP
jgi:cytosine/adenosine deaminase-related metal-dependent hydrolase